MPSTREYANAICKPLNKYFKNKKPRLILEPGRFLVDEAIYLITRVVSVKNIFGVRSLIVDAGVNILPSSKALCWRLNNTSHKPGGLGG